MLAIVLPAFFHYATASVRFIVMHATDRVNVGFPWDETLTLCTTYVTNGYDVILPQKIASNRHEVIPFITMAERKAK